MRHVPVSDPAALPGTPTTPTFALLYLHGWNDYFFQTELARQISRLGGAFYALDLRRYGRSLREGQMPGWITSLTDYDEEISLALAAIRSERGGRPRRHVRALRRRTHRLPVGRPAPRGPDGRSC